MKKVDRREAIKLLASVSTTAALACSPKLPDQESQKETNKKTSPNPVESIIPLPPGNAPWPTEEPFLFCVHHNDRYPKANASFGPDAPLTGRTPGSDFGGRDGWNMYHGKAVPGFPRHPHRGFETITIVRTGLVDHSDSLGATARYGQGDVQWLTAGGGINHAEMFPLLNQQRQNPIDFFQIWLNLPAANKRVPAHFSMLWGPSLPVIKEESAPGKETTITLISGAYKNRNALSSPPHSWASAPEGNVIIWTARMSPHARWTLPPGPPGVKRALYTVSGGGVLIEGSTLPNRHRALLHPEATVTIENKGAPTELLLLGATPIGEPIARHGPFVMNTREELVQTYQEYQRTELGGWPFNTNEPVHGPGPGRFARYPDGRLEKPT